MLRVIRDFRDRADERQLCWCHWKSNATLQEAVSGETDLDLLFSEDDRDIVETLFRDLGALKFRAVPSKRYDKIDDFLAVDDDTARLIHFHVHYQLDIGEKNLKNYRVPYSEEVLASRIQHPELKCWISCHEHELLLLILRQTLRIPAFRFIARKLPSIGRGTRSEFEWLNSRFNRQQFEELCHRWLPEAAANSACAIAASEINPENIRKFNGLLRPCVRGWKIPNSKSFMGRTLFRYPVDKVQRTLRRFSVVIPSKRTFSNKGFMVALVGCDGSGKSSLVKAVHDVFGKKLDVSQIYFGHGASSRSILLSAFKSLSRITAKGSKLLGGKGELSGIIEAMGIMLHKKRSFERADQARRMGFLVVCDRLPQTEIDGMNDGLRLRKYVNADNRYLQGLAKREHEIYSLRESIAPDLVFRLRVDPERAYQRTKGSTRLEVLRRKSDAFSNMRMPISSKVLELENNDIPFEAIRKTVIVETWKQIRRGLEE